MMKEKKGDDIGRSVGIWEVLMKYMLWIYKILKEQIKL